MNEEKRHFHVFTIYDHNNLDNNKDSPNTLIVSSGFLWHIV